MRRKKRIAVMHALTRALSLVLCIALCLSALPARSLSVSESSRLCGHVCEDGTCGYAAGEEGTPCNHICHIDDFDSYTPGTPLLTYAAPDGATYDDILAALPPTLPGRLACAEGAFNIPVKWSCDAFADESGVYTFRAALADAHCDYIVPDDPATNDIDESVDSPYCDLPTAEVTVASPVAPAEPPAVPARGHVCEVTGFTDFDPSAVFAIAQFDKGRTVEELYAEVLPKSLTVTYACACASSVTVLPEIPDDAQTDALGDTQPIITTIALPVTWECADFDPDKTGDYIFTVKALPDYPFTYLKQDNPATVKVDESLLPSILVRVYEPTSPTGKFTVCYGVLNSDGVHVRSGPSTIFESLAQFDTDTPVTVTGQCDHWYRVDIATWKGAFIDQSLITILGELTEAAAPMTGKLNADEVKIRKGPDREYDIITVLPEGATMTVLGRCGNWYFISTEEIEQGYVWREYVTIDPPVPVEEPVCTCTEHCTEGHVNAECPVCAGHPDDCTVRYIAEGYPRMGRVNTENCEVLVGAATLHLHLDTALTLYNEADGLYEFSSDEIAKGFIATELVNIIEYKCTCTVPCTETTCNQLCPVCAAEGWGACAIKELSEQTISAVAEDNSEITISGSLPVGATASVTVVPVETAAEFVAEGAQILFAYDIKILVAGVEWQPDEHVRVSITPPPETPIVTDVAVTHVSEDKDTGAVTASAITDVSTTLSDEAAAQPGAVEFAAEGFSVYIISIWDQASIRHIVNFPVGDYMVEYSTTETGTFKLLTSTTVTLGGNSDTSAKYDTLYFKVTPNAGFSLGTVIASNGVLTSSGDCYTLAVRGADARIDITILVTGVKITGTPAPGQTLIAASSDDLSSPTLTYAWKSCATANGPFVDITEATGSTFVIPSVGTYNNKFIQVVATSDTIQYSSAPVGPVTADGLTFDLAMGSVEIGLLDNDTRIYRGINSAGALVTGAHVDTNEYIVMQSNNTVATSNRIILTGNTSVPKFNVTLDGVNCNTDGNKNAGGIYANAIEATPMEITLKLNNYNYVGRLHYATSGMSSLEDTITSSLTITSAAGDNYLSGYLEAQSAVEWSAAIGGVDDRSAEASRNIYIKGGTIKAIGHGGGSGTSSSPTGTCAIGGGGNGACNIVISGGNVTAANNGTGATIGGGGGNNTEAGNASVTITGGIVNATNNYVNGVAIGSGGSVEKSGGEATVTISGGTVTATGSIGGGSSRDDTGGNATVNISGGTVTVNEGGSIGGGSSTTGNGGTAMVTISGGKVTVNESGNVGGGSSTVSTGGTATVNITGGTVVTPRISGGHNGSNGTYNDAAVSIAAASVNIGDRSNINSVTGPDPANGMPTVVYSQTIDIRRLNGYSSDNYANVAIQSAVLTDGYTYPLKDVYSDSAGKVYFWLPPGCDVTQLTIDGNTYNVEGAQVQTATITHDSSTVGTVLGAVLNYGTPTGYEWQISSDNGDNWDSIDGATSKFYTVVSGNIGKLIRVRISTADVPTITSGSLRITDTPFASIIYGSLEAPATLTGQLLNGSGDSYNYAWQVFNTDSNSYENIAGATSGTFSADYGYIGKHIRVVIFDGDTSYTTSFVVVRAPQLSFTVPINMSVTVDGAGQCTAESGSIANNSAVPVYVKSVAYAWVTDGPKDANELFAHYDRVTATLTLNSTPYSFSNAAPEPVSPTSAAGIVPAKVGDIPGTLSLPWEFTLGTGNYINLVPATGDGVHVATVTYTIDYTPPTP